MNRSSRLKGRHKVLSILFATWIVSHMDRMAMAVALPYISADYQLSPLQSGTLMSAFFAGYALMHIPGGMLADRFGVRRVATIAMLWWSAFTALTGAAANLTQMLAIRFVFGLGEGVFPACAFKTIAVWFPKRERATANAIMLASNPLGIAISPLVVVGIMSFWNWQFVFYALFLPGILVAILFWIFVPDSPSDAKNISAEEVAEIDDGDALRAPPENKTGLKELLEERDIFKYFFSYFTYAIAIWGFTVWLPTYLVKVRGLSMVEMGMAASLPFFTGSIGCVLGGWISDRFFARSRKVPIIAANIIAAAALYGTSVSSSIVVALVCQSVAGFCLMIFLSSFWALPMNSISREVMGVASGFINMAGQLAGMISPVLIGFLIGAAGGNYDVAFLFMVGSLLTSCVIVLAIRPELRTPATDIGQA